MSTERTGSHQRPLLELTRARILEFVREPEAMFWVFVFPVLLAFALGIAFRSEPTDRPAVGVISGDAPAAVALADSLRHDTRLDVQILDAAAAARALRKGRLNAVAELTAAGDSVVYRYDATRAEGQAARLALDDAVQRARGRRDIVASTKPNRRAALVTSIS